MTDTTGSSLFFSFVPSMVLVRLVGSRRLPRSWWTPIICVLARRGLVSHVELVDDDGSRW